MASSESSTTPAARRLALQDISVNAVVVHQAARGGGARQQVGSKPGHPAKPAELAAEARAAEPAAGAEHGALRREARLGGQKRVFGLVQGGDGREEASAEDARPQEGRAAEGGGAKRKRVKAVGEVHDDDEQPHQGVRSDNAACHLPVYEEDTSSSGLSPGSSLGCSQHGLNDSQTTVITEPDDACAGFLRGEVLRQRARALKLRLSLAKYKVQTNQIDTPMSQLQIKSTSESPELPTAPRLVHTPRNRPSSSAPHPSKNPNLKPQEPNPADTRSFSSSPPPYPEPAAHNGSVDGAREAISTPLLPRQRQSLLYPPSLGGDFEDRSPARELTSSVVKGRAAKGLLSLMGHQG